MEDQPLDYTGRMSKSPHGRPRGGQTHAAAHKPPRSPEWAVLSLAAVGLLITGYLTVVALSGGQALFCAAGSACDVVQGSRFSRFLGVPVALWGFAVYALIALVAWRMPAQLRRWRRLWALSLLGVAVSVYLTVAGAVALDAFCAWCLASLATMAAIFGTVAWRRPDSAPGMRWSRWLLSSGIGALTVVAVLGVAHSGLLQGREDPRLQALAVHLEATGAKFYGASWCAVCQRQKRLFGASAERLPYVECTPGGRTGPMAIGCISADVQGYPTWVIGGERYQEVLTPERLERLSRFRWRAEASE